MSAKPEMVGMQRPVMDPTFLAKPRAGRHAPQWTTWVLPGLKWLLRTLVSRPFSIRTPRPIKPLAYVLAAAGRQFIFLPLILAATSVILVYAGTHPTLPPLVSDPNSQGVYYDPVNLVSDDGTRLTGWLIPAVDARRVLEEKDKFLRSRRPGVVLVHDFGQTQQQVLPLLAPLHDEGMVLVVIGLRGAGNGRPAGQTFGINEAADIKAAVEMLRRRPSVDPDRIAVLGLGTGATAALLAAEHDPQIAAMVIADPIRSANEAVAQRIGPHQAWMAWLRPACKWAFELSYHVSADDVNLERFAGLTQLRPTLMLPPGSDRATYFDASRVGAIREFLATNLHRSDAVASAAK
ncbi:MAG TPA: prolyl oligopeptidase family serine peptidase [Tepidisphaeraceae bacterium]|jgi:pimeloyl-ACP methyl ester carboxylesterase|nr:prolyl oligopeptidase family serine peptidase [Tepidisphaeraceae bacterium]